MFTVRQPSSARAAIAGLKVAIPSRPTLEKVLTSIQNRESNIHLPSLLLSQADMQRLIEAFNLLPAKSDMTLWISQTFTNPRDEVYEDLIAFWNAIKNKVKTVTWDQNRFHKKFLHHLAQEIKQDANLARCEFQLCDNTDSSASASAAHTPLSRANTPKFFSLAPSPKIEPVGERTYSPKG